jgi:hypothetical protein
MNRIIYPGDETSVNSAREDMDVAEIRIMKSYLDATGKRYTDVVELLSGISLGIVPELVNDENATERLPYIELIGEPKKPLHG